MSIKTNKYSAIPVTIKSGDVVSTQFYYYVRDRHHTVTLHFKHDGELLETNLAVFGSLIYERILKEKLLPVY